MMIRAEQSLARSIRGETYAECGRIKRGPKGVAACEQAITLQVSTSN